MKKTIAFLLVVFVLDLYSPSIAMGADSSFEPASTTKSKKKTSSRSKSSTKNNQRSSTPLAKSKSSTTKQTDSAGPEWIDGTWVYKGYVNTSWGAMYMNVALVINRASQTLTYGSGKEIVEYGSYDVYDGAIHCGSTYWNIDYSNHRLELGNGAYMNKK